MPEETPQATPEVPRQKRKYTRRKPIVPKIAGTVKDVVPPPPPVVTQRRVPEKALNEIDSQLTAAISAIPELEDQLTILDGKCAEANQRLTRVQQRIVKLLDLQRQLSGDNSITVTGGTGVTINPPMALNPPELDPRVAGMIPGMRDVPPGVSSIPARQPKPNSGNVADQARDAGGWK